MNNFPESISIAAWFQVGSLALSTAPIYLSSFSRIKNTSSPSEKESVNKHTNIANNANEQSFCQAGTADGLWEWGQREREGWMESDVLRICCCRLFRPFALMTGKWKWFNFKYLRFFWQNHSQINKRGINFLQAALGGKLSTTSTIHEQHREGGGNNTY